MTQNGHHAPSERSPLLSNRRDHGPSNGSTDNTPQSDIARPSAKLIIPLCIAVWVPVLVSSLDSTIVATLVGSISSSFNKSEQSAWLGTSYLLSVCCFTPIYGRLCDAMGRRNTMLLALFFFSMGTLLCGLATSMEMLITARALAGVGGGGLMTCTSTILSDVVPLRDRGLYQGLTNIIYGLGSGMGGPVGGLLNDTLGWHNAFLVQMPLLVISVLLTIFFVHGQPPSSDESRHVTSAFTKLKTIDLLGSFTLVGCVAPILLGLSFMSADDRSFTEPIVYVSLLAGVLSGIAFALVEKFIAKAPILPLQLVTKRNGASAGLANFFLSVTTFTVLYNYPLIFQATRLMTSSQAGLHLIPNATALSFGSVLAGLWMRQTGYYYSYNFACSIIMVLGLAWLSMLKPTTPDWVTYIAVIPSGFAVSSILTCTLLALINSVPRSEIAVATGMSYLFRTTGQVVGVSLSGALLQAVLKTELRKRITDEKLISSIRHQSSIIRTLPKEIQKAAIDSYEIALRDAFLFGLGAAICTALCCYLMENRKLPDVAKPQSNQGRENEED